MKPRPYCMWLNWIKKLQHPFFQQNKTKTLFLGAKKVVNHAVGGKSE